MSLILILMKHTLGDVHVRYCAGCVLFAYEKVVMYRALIDGGINMNYHLGHPLYTEYAVKDVKE